jgi:hypothetical protein
MRRCANIHRMNTWNAHARFLRVIGLGLLVLAGCAKETPAPVPASPAPLTPAAVATTRQVMLGLTIPASDVLFQVGNAAPKDDVEWEKVQANAAMLAESANLLLVSPRLIDTPEWKGFAQNLLSTSKAALEAAQAHDVDKVLDVGNQIYEVCDGCHKKYMAARAGE